MDVDISIKLRVDAATVPTLAKAVAAMALVIGLLSGILTTAEGQRIMHLVFG